MSRIAIIGAGGFAREVTSRVIAEYARYIGNIINGMYVDEEYMPKGEPYIKVRGNKIPVLNIKCLQDSLKIQDYEIIIAISNPEVRKNVVKKLPINTKYLNNDRIIAPGCQLTVDCTIGNHVIINLNCTIGHDVVIEDYCTLAPGVNLSGNVTLGECVEIGTNACVKEKVTICDNVIIGMGSVVLNDITEPGTYVGNPVRKIK